jgi:hypothetical protein
MCRWGTVRRVRIQAGWNASGEPHTVFGYDIPIDACIADIVEVLNASGISTRNSCCGHGKGLGRIDLADGRILWVSR